MRVAARAGVGLLGKQSQLLRRGNLVRVSFRAVAVLVCIGHRAIPARTTRLGDIITIIITFVIKHLAINEIASHVFIFRAVNYHFRKQALFVSDSLNDASIHNSPIIFNNTCHILGAVGMAVPSNATDTIDRN